MVSKMIDFLLLYLIMILAPTATYGLTNQFVLIPRSCLETKKIEKRNRHMSKHGAKESSVPTLDSKKYR
jgi:hypothetical protein